MTDKKVIAKRAGQIKTIKAVFDKANGMCAKNEIIEKDFAAFLKNISGKQTS